MGSELASSVILFPGAPGLSPVQALRGAEESTNGNGEESQKLHQYLGGSLLRGLGSHVAHTEKDQRKYRAFVV